MTDGFRSKDYDPLKALRDRVYALEKRTDEAESRLEITDRRLTRLHGWREQRKRYTELRGFRARAISALVAMDKLTLDEIGAAFGISKQRVEQIATIKRKRGRPRKEQAHDPHGRGDEVLHGGGATLETLDVRPDPD